MTFIEAAVEVLKRSKRPLTADEILSEAQRRGLLSSKGKTPKATLSAALYTNLKRKKSPFERVFKPGELRAKRGSVRWRLKR
jgi:hypothetical protein